jgi:hypothetical protein
MTLDSMEFLFVVEDEDLSQSHSHGGLVKMDGKRPPLSIEGLVHSDGAY